MKLISPFTIIQDALQDRASYSATCFIDETEVALKECGALIEAKEEEAKLDFWDEECAKHPNNSHCKVFEE